MDIRSAAGTGTGTGRGRRGGEDQRGEQDQDVRGEMTNLTWRLIPMLHS